MDSSIYQKIISCVIGFSLMGLPADAQQSKPNIVLILADDLGYSDLGCYGSEIHTPHLDKLAAEGLRFRNFYNAGRCCPTRASLLTGQYPHDAGMGHMVSYADQPITPGPYQGFLRPDRPTIAEVLRKAGYSTYMSGKWHVGERPQHWPRKRGFDRYFGLISGASSYYELVDEKRRRVMVRDDEVWEPPAAGFYMTDAFTDTALAFVDQHYNDEQTNSQPFFLYLAYTAPHWPLHAPDTVVAKYEALYLQGWDEIRKSRFERMKATGVIDQRYTPSSRPDDIPAWDPVDDKKQWARKMAVYAAMIEIMDDGIGKIVDQLDEKGALDNTLIVFLSDNGACAESVERRGLNDATKRIGDRGSYVAYETPWAYASNTPFRKYKKYMHEGGIATPSIWYWPRVIKQPGEFIDVVGHITDLMPTLSKLAGADDNRDTPGTSLVPFLNGDEDAKKQERTIYWEHEGNVALRKDDWKLVKDKEDPAWALYHLGRDPTESKNLGNLYPEKLKEMQGILSEKLKATKKR